jgi:hypothetical protein
MSHGKKVAERLLKIISPQQCRVTEQYAQDWKNVE